MPVEQLNTTYLDAASLDLTFCAKECGFGSHLLETLVWAAARHEPVQRR